MKSYTLIGDEIYLWCSDPKNERPAYTVLIRTDKGYIVAATHSGMKLELHAFSSIYFLGKDTVEVGKINGK